MKANEIRIEKNNARIEELKTIVAKMDELHAMYRAKKISWDEYYKIALANGNVKGNAEDEIEDLIMWNNLLTGEKVYFNGSSYTDVHPYEVMEILTPTQIVLREMKAKASKDAKPYSNDWDIESDENGAKEIAIITETKRGLSIKRKGDKCYRFSMCSEPNYYFDYSF